MSSTSTALAADIAALAPDEAARVLASTCHDVVEEALEAAILRASGHLIDRMLDGAAAHWPLRDDDDADRCSLGSLCETSDGEIEDLPVDGDEAEAVPQAVLGQRAPGRQGEAESCRLQQEAPASEQDKKKGFNPPPRRPDAKAIVSEKHALEAPTRRLDAARLGA
mmetsp:Transcript_93075/g.251279  ORF Transcript_93075/g.251279 Transcript_93075/m.251279 type:complete len:166 (+) Transcript_93075:39-536(+)